jgi:pimeloyl-ACP methyl ester carboxylesterase
VSSTPEQRADDLARLIRHVYAGPATGFGSSGGAVTAPALAQAHPELVGMVIAHEPPLDRLVEDGEELLAATERTTTALAAGLGIEPTRFPGDHTGFAAAGAGPFAAVLREVL